MRSSVDDVRIEGARVQVKSHDLYRWIVVARTGVVGQFDCGGGFPLVSECRRRIFGKIARGNDDGLKTASAFRDSMETATPERSVSL